MILDSRSFSNNQTFDADVCIVGAGVAGITLACELESLSIKVALLESGGLNFSSKPQSLYKGENVGKAYSTDTSRLRFFGGTSNHWGGNCRELSDLDFKERKWVPNSGWPFAKEELSDYYRRAAHYCKLNIKSADGFDPLNVDGEHIKVLDHSNNVATHITQFAPSTPGEESFTSLNFGKEYLDKIEGSESITLFLHANVTDILPNSENTTVATMKIACIDGPTFNLRAKHFVLATGGIENARLLLSSKSKNPQGLGNENDVVGRYFMEHLGVRLGIFSPSNSDLSKLDMFEVPGRRIAPQANKLIRTKGYFTFPSPVHEKEKILATSITLNRFFLPPSHESDAYISLKAIVGDLRFGMMPINFIEHLKNVTAGLDDVSNGLYWKYVDRNKPMNLYDVGLQCEQAPNPDSRVTLSREKDILGMNKVKLNWQTTELDIHTIRRAAVNIATEFGYSSHGRLMITLPESDLELDKQIKGDWHHMGTTRMSDDPKKGVVDRNCRVHSMANLFVAGSSVFPTGGHSVPTFTIVALAIRLADHIKRTLKV